MQWKISMTSLRGRLGTAIAFFAATCGALALAKANGISDRTAIGFTLMLLVVACLIGTMFRDRQTPSRRQYLLMLFVFAAGALLADPFKSAPPKVQAISFKPIAPKISPQVKTIALNSQENSKLGQENGWHQIYKDGCRIWSHLIPGATALDNVATECNDPDIGKMSIYTKPGPNGWILFIVQRLHPLDEPIYPTVRVYIMPNRGNESVAVLPLR